MTIQWGDTGKVAYGALKTFTITYATPRENLSGSPTALPSTNPGSSSAQASFTVATGDLPTISPSPISTLYTACVFIGGKNTDVANQTINYQCYKNGATVTGASGTLSVVSGQYWTLSNYRFNGVVTGDVLSVSVWCASANVNYDYVALAVLPTQMNLGKAYLNKDVTYSSFMNVPNLTQGTPGVSVNQSFYTYPSDASNNGFSIGSNTNFGALKWNGTYSSGRANYGDNNVTTIAVSNASNRPYYSRNSMPTQISFREVLR